MKRKREEKPWNPNKEIKISTEKINHLLQEEHEEHQECFNLLLDKMKECSVEDFASTFEVLKKEWEVQGMDPMCQFKKLLFSGEEDAETYVYYGTHRNERRHGVGICIYKNRYYDGCWNDGKEHVYGVLTYFQICKIVKGEWRNGTVRHGTVIYKEGDFVISEYRGGLKHMKPDRFFYHGRGMLRLSESLEKKIYCIGMFRNSMFKEGTYVGDFDSGVVTGKFNVKGEDFVPVGNMTVRYPRVCYVGGLDEYFKYHGEGTLCMESEEEIKYVGGFKDGDYDGYGTMYSKDGSKYEGNWRAGARQGYGIMHLPKDRYEGGFKDDVYDGYGVFYSENGDIYDGMWKNDKLNGNALIKSKKGWTFEGEFVDGKKSNKGCWNFYDGKTKEFNKDCLYIEDTDENDERYALYKHKKEADYVYELEFREGTELQSIEVKGMEKLKKLIPVLNKVEKTVSEEEIEKFKCKLCCYKDVEVLFSSCNHLCTCEECSFRVSQCPICRKTIEKKIKVFI